MLAGVLLFLLSSQHENWLLEYNVYLCCIIILRSKMLENDHLEEM